MQDDIDHHVTRDRLNNASFRQRVDSISENIFQRQSSLELVFEDISTFDAQNSTVGFLLRELDIGKKDLASELIKKAPRPSIDLSIQKRLEAFRNDNSGFSNNNGGAPSPLPSPPGFNNFIPPLQFPPPLPPSSQRPRYFPPPPPTPSPVLSPLLSPTPFRGPKSSLNQTQPPTHFGEITMTKTNPNKEKVLENIDMAIYKIPVQPQLEIGDPLLNFLSTDTE